MADRGQCRFCGRPVQAHETAAFPIHGWEVERDQGGANRILGREREPDVVAHAVCVETHLKLGAQGSLLEGLK